MEIPEGELRRLAHEGGLFMAGMVFGGCMSSDDTFVQNVEIMVRAGLKLCQLS